MPFFVSPAQRCAPGTWLLLCGEEAPEVFSGSGQDQEEGG